MNKEQRMEAWEVRKTQYANQWKIGLMGACGADPGFCCAALCCPPCVSYSLRKRALYNNMDRYQCCNGSLPCSGKCGESSCPEFCLCCESNELQSLADIIYFIAEALWWSVCACMQTQHKVQMDERDVNRGPQQQGGPVTAPQPQIMLTPQASPAAYPPPGYPGSGVPQQQAAYPPPGYPGVGAQQNYPPAQPMYERTAGYAPQPAYMGR